MKLEGAVFVVTGGASGIGEGAVRMAVGNGAKAVIWDMNEKRGQAIVAELGTDKVLYCNVNVTDAAGVDAALEAAVQKFGRVDCCINCAGIGPSSPTVNKKNEPHSIDKFIKVIQLNLIGSFLCGSRCAAQMYKQDPSAEGERGLIINIASVAAMDGQNGQAAYSASKNGVVGMTLPMARDMGKFGVRVNTICPGIIDTPMGGIMEPVPDRDIEKMPKVLQSLLGAQCFPNRRFGRPDEIANLIKFMAETTFMNAETVRMDAGVRMPKL